VQDDFCKQLIQLFGKAIVSTSANISGNQAPKQFSEISDEIKNNVDYIVNLRQNELMFTPSTILMINKDGSIKKIRW
jgi:L-threonylcarbamoyladenylate synthase